MTHLPHPPCRRALENTFPNALFGCWRSRPRDQLRPGISRDHVLHNWGSRVLSAPAAPWVTWNALGAHGSFVFLFSPLGCPCSSALHKSPRSCCPLVWTGNFPSPQIIYSFLSMQFSSRWKPLCSGHPLSSRQLDLCSPARLGKGWGVGEQGRASLGFWRSPKYLLNCRVFSAAGHLSKAGTSFSTSLGWEMGRGREGTDVMRNHRRQT